MQNSKLFYRLCHCCYYFAIAVGPSEQMRQLIQAPSMPLPPATRQKILKSTGSEMLFSTLFKTAFVRIQSLASVKQQMF